MTHDDSHILAAQLATHGQEATGIECTILRLLLNVWYQLDVLHLEESGIVEQGAVDATAVRSLDVAILHATSLQGFLLDERIKHLVVLDLGHADEGAAHLRQLIRAHVGESLGHIVQLVGIFHTIPSLCRKILIVVLALVVASVEEILLVVETYGIEIVTFLPLGDGCQTDYQQGGEHKKIFLHDLFLLLIFIIHKTRLMCENTLSECKYRHFI